MKTIHILEIETGNEAHAIRACAEYWGCAVTVTWCGNASQIVDYLSSRPAHDLIIISGHGDTSGLLLPVLHETLQDKHPYATRISPGQFREFVNLAGSTVLNLSCESGRELFAEAFLSCGAGFYLGPLGSPDGSDALMYALEFLHAFIVGGASIADAHMLAADHSDDRSLFRLYGIKLGELHPVA